jgi:membrane-bound lytic murein transglycosylase D
MKKTFFIMIEEKKRFFYYLFCYLIVLTVSLYLGGCSGSKEPKVEANRAQDSINIYSAIESAFKQYKEALVLNESQNDKTKESFEQSLKILKKVDNRILEDPKYLVWKKDYAELSRSIVQDYLYTQSNISEKSLVFKFAKKFDVEFEEVKKYEDVEATDPLPDGSDVPLIRNKAVDEYIDFFSKTDRGRGFIDKTLYRSGKYFPIMRKILKYYGAPEELIYLSVQESGLNPTIVSRAGAVGLWQFMATTGSAYGLSQDDKRDDRRDFEKSTDAAARHLKDLYRSLGDWYLAFAAYNAGPGRITGAINKSGSRDYWEIRNYLPGETKNYVPSILAISFIFRNPEDYGFKNIEYGKPVSYDKVNILGEVSLEKVAEFCDSDIETIRELNSELTKDAIPSYSVPYQLRIPHGTYKTFVANYQKSPEFAQNNSSVPEYAGNESKGYQSEVSDVTYTVSKYNPGDPKTVGVSTGKMKLAYKFRTNDNIINVADSFYVRPTDLRIWNSISYPSQPLTDQNLAIYLPEKQYNKFMGIKEPEVIETEKVTTPDTTTYQNKTDDEKKTNVETIQKPKKNVIKVNTGSQTYVVKEGDNLGLIAEAYNVTVAEIKEWNNLEDDKILAGQKLKLYSDKPIEKKINTKNKTTYIVEEGDYLSSIANAYGVTVNDLKEWNELESDVIFVGQKLIVAEPQKKTKDTKKTKTHVVKGGETLNSIAVKYDVTIAEIKKWNGLKSDVIQTGQTLIVSESKSKKNETTVKEKTHKVKKGDTLRSIADEYDITIRDLKKWNELDSDVIKIGQVLIVSPKKKK